MSSLGQVIYNNNNTALGAQALADFIAATNYTGYGNTGIGASVLSNLAPGESESTAVGLQALETAIFGGHSGFGAFAGANIGTAPANAHFGNWAGRFISGDFNTSHGYRAMAGDQNTNGFPSLGIAFGRRNAAFGGNALRFYPGDDNAAHGFNALNLINGGDGNVAFGSGAGASVVNGSSNTLLGFGADVLGGNAQRRTAIGAGAIAAFDNTIVLGLEELVGIGTNNPAARLHVTDDVNPALFVDGGLRYRVMDVVANGSITVVGRTDHVIIVRGGSAGQSIILPGPEILQIGQTFRVRNISTGTIAVLASSGFTTPFFGTTPLAQVDLVPGTSAEFIIGFDNTLPTPRLVYHQI